MDDIEYIALAKTASNVSATAKECAAVVQLIRQAGDGAEDPALENLKKDFSCFVDASRYLCLQLSTPDAGLAANEWGDRFWTSVRLVLELWLKNTKRNLEHLQGFQKQRASTWTGWFFSSSRFTRLMEDFEVVNLDTRIEEAQLIAALFNFQLELQNVHQTHNGNLGFLSKDLEWKAMKLQINMSRVRYQQNLDPRWGRTQDIIAESALSTAARQNLLDQPAETPIIETMEPEVE